MANKIELSYLTLDAYNGPGQRQGYDRFKPLGNGIDDPKTGLRIQAYIDKDSKEIVISAAGSNDKIDWTRVNPSFVTGKLHAQFKDAITYANEIRNNPEYAGYKISTSGHSLGGGIAQLLSKTFGFTGISTDAPGAARIADSQDYKDFVTKIGITPVEKVNFVNFTEKGSPVNKFGEHIGTEMNFNIVSDKKTWLGRGLMLFGQDPITKGLGLYIRAKDIAEQHNKLNFPSFFTTTLDANYIDGYSYENGKWFKLEKYDARDGIDEEHHEVKEEAHPDIAKKLDAKRALYIELNNDQNNMIRHTTSGMNRSTESPATNLPPENTSNDSGQTLNPH